MTLVAINHHYYRTASTGRGIYPTTPEELRREVSQIRAQGWRIGNQDDLAALASGQPSAERVCILTFDDGLREQMNAVRDLAVLGAGAICFVPTGPIIDRYVLDVHKLQMIRSEVDDEYLAGLLDKRFGLRKCAFDEQLLAIQYRYDNELSRKVKYFINFLLDEATRQAWLSDVFVELFGDERSAAQRLYMTVEDLVELARLGALGSHAHSHLPLATLAEKGIADEVGRSFDFLMQVSGVAPLGISYPYGGKSAVSDAVFSASAACGYRYGFTMMRGVNSAADQLDPMALNRIDTNDRDAWLTVAV